MPLYHCLYHCIPSFFRCLSDDLCVACATTDDKRYVIIQRRGTAQEKQTLVSAADGAIFIGKILVLTNSWADFIELSLSPTRKFFSIEEQPTTYRFNL